MILTTTNAIEGYKVIEYKGIVTGISYDKSYSYKGKDMSFKDMFSISKYYEIYEEGMQSIKEQAFQKLTENAKKMNANAIIGITVDIETVANSTSVLVSVTGTAVNVTAEK